MMNKILVIDDDIGLLEVIESILSHQGFDVIACFPEIDIISVAILHKPDLIIIDFLMNEVNGGELCSLLKKHSVTRDIPIIIITAYGKMMYSLGTYGCDLYLPKPLNFMILVNSIKDLLYTHTKAYIYN